MPSGRVGGNIHRLLGKAIRARREILGISQEELGFRSRLHRTYVADIERGARNPSLQSIVKLADALDFSLSDLFAHAQVTDLSRGEWDQANPQVPPVEILLVEDNPHDAELAIEALRRCHLRNHIHLVSDGAAALDFVFGEGQYTKARQGRKPSVVLLDLGLPEIDGLEVLRRIKADGRGSRIPVIVLTASQHELDLAESQRLGADDYIIKPVDFQQFSQKIPRVGLHWLLVEQPIQAEAL